MYKSIAPATYSSGSKCNIIWDVSYTIYSENMKHPPVVINKWNQPTDGKHNSTIPKIDKHINPAKSPYSRY